MSAPAKIVLGAVLVVLLAYTFLDSVEFETRDDFLSTFGVFVAAWLTIVILSFLYQDNPFYKAAEHVMVGVAMGYFTVYYVFQLLKPRFYDKLVGGILEEGDILFGSPEVFRWALLIPAVLGILMLTRLVPKIAWLSRWSIAASIGIASGLAIPVTIQANITTQLKAATLLPILYLDSLGNGPVAGIPDVTLWEIGVPVLVIGTVCALTYFFFSVPHRGIVGKAAALGVWILMVGFGASFGYTVMARLSLLIGRVLFLLRDWLHFLPG